MQLRRIRVGDVELSYPVAPRAELVPRLYSFDAFTSSQRMLSHIRWMLQKDALGQDMFLLGPPGATRRRLAMWFGELTGREVESVTITNDTTEADLKQRREMRAGSVVYVDQAPVRAAIEGRVLLLDGIERAERNVLPALNNLLENRELSLQDGRMLLSPFAFDHLVATGHTPSQLAAMGLVRVSPLFRVIALGLPVPAFPGFPLDPPLRSRFQVRVVDHLHHDDAGRVLSPPPSSPLSPHLALAQQRLALLAATLARMRHQATPTTTAGTGATAAAAHVVPLVPESFIGDSLAALELLPEQRWSAVARRSFPIELATDNHLVCRTINEQLAALDDAQHSSFERSIASITPHHDELRNRATVALRVTTAADTLRQFSVAIGSNWCGAATCSTPTTAVAPIGSQREALVELLVSHALGRDLLLYGAKGSGKSTVARLFGETLGYRVRHVALYKDMTARDLLQQRALDRNGDTVWRHSPLIEGALAGDLVVLDGLQRVDSDTLAVLQPLVHDRDLTLPDTTRLLRADRFEHLMASTGASAEELAHRGIRRIHPSFRIVAITLHQPQQAQHTSAATPTLPTSSSPAAKSHLLSADTTCLFACHRIAEPSVSECEHILRHRYPELTPSLVSALSQLLLSLAPPTLPLGTSAAAPPDPDAAPSVPPHHDELSLSLRQVLQLARRVARYPSDLHSTLRRILMVPLMPPTIRENIEHAIQQFSSAATGVVPQASANDDGPDGMPLEPRIIEYPQAASGLALAIGDVVAPVAVAGSSSLVPNIVYYNVPAQTSIMHEMLKDLTLGERHLLAIGNQGCGKNRIADRLLQLLRREREYMQLHRDTTVQSLTQSPSIIGGQLHWEDSPLVKAAKFGRVLLLDEVDKAPLEVVCILKGLVEDGEMTLANGQRIVSYHHNAATAGSESALPEPIVMHPEFRMILLANRPGFPFLVSISL